MVCEAGQDSASLVCLCVAALYVNIVVDDDVQTQTFCFFCI